MKKTYYLVVGKSGESVPGIRANGKRIYKERLSVFKMCSRPELCAAFIMAVQNSNRALFALQDKPYRLSPMQVLEITEDDIIWENGPNPSARVFYVVVHNKWHQVPNLVTDVTHKPVLEDTFVIERIFESKDEADAYAAQVLPKGENLNVWDIELDGESTFSPYFKFALKELRNEWNRGIKPPAQWQFIKKVNREFAEKKIFSTYQEAQAEVRRQMEEVKKGATGVIAEKTFIAKNNAQVVYDAGKTVAQWRLKTIRT